MVRNLLAEPYWAMQRLGLERGEPDACALQAVSSGATRSVNPTGHLSAHPKSRTTGHKVEKLLRTLSLSLSLVTSHHQRTEGIEDQTKLPVRMSFALANSQMHR